MAKCPQFVLMYIDFGPRATLKRTFVVVIFVVVGVESSSKNVPHRTKNVQGKKMWHIMVLNCFCLVWPSVILYGIFWPRIVLLLFTAMVSFDLAWRCGLVCSCMAIYGLLWSCVAFFGLYGLFWQIVVFSRGHRSKLIWFC